LAIVAMLVAGLLTGPATSAAAADGRRSYTGTIGAAKYRVELPERWNGTLVLFSHGYYPPEFAPEETLLANRVETENWLLDHGYALAASDFTGKVGYVVKDAPRDQLALLDWFTANVGRPHRTISSGMSMGGDIAVLLAERNPGRVDGVLAQCAEFDGNGSWNTGLDITFAIKTLLAPDQGIELVKARDPVDSTNKLIAAVETAKSTKDGRARLALAAAFGAVPGWADAHAPAPTELVKRIEAQAAWLAGAYAWGIGPQGRADLEPRVGGNPSWNVGVDYGRLLARSGQRKLAEQAYRDAGLDLRADLDKLATAPRIRPDLGALADMYRDTIVRGTTPVPVLTMHNTDDGGAVVDQERWYAEQVRRNGDPSRLRQLYVNRGGHCAFSAADEVVALRGLETRINTGRWPDLSPNRLNATVAGFAPEYTKVLDFFKFTSEPMPPAFVNFTPPPFLRPSR
jgi:pimeloyl-ACP methyl ester carboxylesterase